MNRVLTVKGTGRVSAPPDRIEIHLTLLSLRKEYEEAMRLAQESLMKLQQAAESAGLEAKELKTGSFSVNAEYEYVEEESAPQQRRFVGYSVRHRLLLRFAMDTQLLAEVLSAVAAAGVQPEMQIRFTLEDPKKLIDEMLGRAVRDAAEKAALLARASGVELGEIMAIDYDWDEISFYSATDYLMSVTEGYRGKALAMDIAPKDIEQSDTVRVVWAIR